MLHLLLMSLVKVETARGRRNGSKKDAAKKMDVVKKKKQIIKRSSDKFFFDAAEEEKRLIRVLWNVRKYFHIDIAECGEHGLTTISHERLSSVSDWSDVEQVSSFLDFIRPANKSTTASPKSRKNSTRRPKTKGKCAVTQPSCSSDSEQDQSYLSSEESSAQEIAAAVPSSTCQPAEDMAVDRYEDEAESIFSNDASVKILRRRS